MTTNRVQIEYDFTFETPFHCGTGIREGLIDRTVVRDNEQYLYIPGSTFKGVLREHCEQLARFYDGEKQKIQPGKRKTQPIESPHNAEAALEWFGESKPNMVTRVFGSQLAPGKLFFDDVRQDDKKLQQYRIEGEDRYKSLQATPYTQVRLDRLTRTAAQGALYTSEFGASNIVFKGTIQGWLTCDVIPPASHPVFAQAQKSGFTPTFSLLLLLTGLHMIERLGGNKSTGKGKCTCKISKVLLNGQECAADMWRGWLEQLDVLAYYNTVEE
ncbi:MAG TPA: RAMP superfamily CRISPR-associated protein [Ktedonobacteraceae bacterium]|nr:RAMP superfamily CRISPR-associated protein [Ktedonobacteraceae bacterium]